MARNLLMHTCAEHEGELAEHGPQAGSSWPIEAEGLIDAIVGLWQAPCEIMTQPIGEADEVFHPAGDDDYWNESGWFGFSIPERDINGFVYYFHDVRTGVSGGGPALWDPSGEEPYDCLFYDWRWRQPPTGPLDFRDFRLPNSLTARGASNRCSATGFRIRSWGSTLISSGRR